MRYCYTEVIFDFFKSTYLPPVVLVEDHAGLQADSNEEDHGIQAYQSYNFFFQQIVKQYYANQPIIITEVFIDRIGSPPLAQT